MKFCNDWNKKIKKPCQGSSGQGDVCTKLQKSLRRALISTKRSDPWLLFCPLDMWHLLGYAQWTAWIVWLGKLRWQCNLIFYLTGQKYVKHTHRGKNGYINLPHVWLSFRIVIAISANVVYDKVIVATWSEFGTRIPQQQSATKCKLEDACSGPSPIAGKQLRSGGNRLHYDTGCHLRTFAE